MITEIIIPIATPIIMSDDLWSCPRGGLPVDVGTMASPDFDATDVVGFIMSEHVDGSNAGILWNNPM